MARAIALGSLVLVLSGPLPATGRVLGGAADDVLTQPPVLAPEPPMPEMLGGLQYGDPAEGIGLVGVPQPDNHGEAQTSFAIDIPPGRLDWQPDLALSYASRGPNGWAGLGWDIGASSIGIDTRWGVPRYDPVKESETYSFEGEQLSPTAHRADQLDREPERIFTKRVEDTHSLIKRHGDHPSNYWWEVHDKLGNKFFYGRTPDGDPGVPEAILRDGRQHAYWWGLVEQHDISLNTVTYFYTKVDDPGVSREGAPIGSQLYLSRVNYTGSVDTDDDDGPDLPRFGPYDVTFIRDRDLPGFTPRRDATIDARSGALRVTADLLRHVEVSFTENGNRQLVRRYDLGYQTGPFEKTLLASISQAGVDGQAFATHTFEYFNEVQKDGQYDGFEEGLLWDVGADTDDVGTEIGGVRPTALGGAVTSSGDGRFYLGFNPFTPDKSFSIGAGFALSGSDSETDISLIDLNGDGLPDKVWKQGRAGIRYRLNQTRPDTEPSFGEVRSTNLPGLPEDSSFGVSVGPEAYVLVLGVMYAHGWTFTTGTSYFSDVNGDGLVDFVDNGTVYFNYLDEDKLPRFSTDSSLTAVPISDQGYDPSLLPDDADLEARARQQFPLVDTVRRWVAPWGGGVRVTGPITLADGASVDGVRIALQRNGTELWSTTIAPGSTAAVSPPADLIPVSRGDRLYFRVQSVDDGGRDAVNWAPIVTYQGPAGEDLGPQPDANGQDAWSYSALDEFTLAGRTGVFTKMPLDGDVRVSGTVRKTRATTDDVEVRIEHNGVPVAPSVPVIPADFVGDVVVDRTFTVARPVPGPGGNDTFDRVALRLAVDSPIDVTALSWTEAPVPAGGSPSGPRMYYVSATDLEGQPLTTTDSAGRPTIEIKAPYDIDVYPQNTLNGPQGTWVWPGDDPQVEGERRTVRVEARVGVSEALAAEHFPLKVTATAKGLNRLAGKATGEIVLSPGLGVLPADLEFEIEVVEGQPYWLDVSTLVPEAGPLLMARVEVLGSEVDYAVHWPRLLAGDGEIDAFPQPYRGWGYAGYNGDGPRATQAMGEDAFVLKEDEFPQDESEAPTDFEEIDTDYKNPLKGNGYPYLPDPAQNRWQGPKAAAPTNDQDSEPRANIRGATFGAAGGFSSSRLGPDSVLNPTGSVGTGRAPVMRGRAEQDTIGASVGVGPAGLSAGVSWGFSQAKNGFMDLNGDAYPDIIGSGPGGMRIQYTTEVGGLHGSIGTLHGDPSSSREAASVLQGQGAAPAIKGKIAVKSTDGKSAARMSAGVNLGFSGGVGHAETNHTGGFNDALIWQEDDIATDFADLNGDFLPDRIRVDAHGDVQVRWNLGYGFSEEFQFPDETEDFSKSQNDNYSVGASVGFNLGRFDFAGGVSIQNDEQHTDLTWVDMNGDFLPDQVEGLYSGEMRASRDGVRVRFNTGSGLGPPVNFGNFRDDQVARSESFGVGGGADFTVGIGPICWPVKLCYIIVNAGGHGERSVTAPRTALVDVDGDFLPDSVSSSNHHSMEVNRNKTGRTNLLKSISRPLGAHIELDYDRSGTTVDQPFPLWALTEVRVFDGHSGDGDGGDGDDTAVTRWAYDESNVFDFRERDYFGFATVLEHHLDGCGDTYRTIERTYLNGNYYERGLAVAETLFDGAGRRYTATVNDYTLLDISTGAPADLGSPPSTTASVFPALTRVARQWFDPEADASPVKQLDTETTYDHRGNPVRMTDLGEPGAGDDLAAETTYTQCDAHPDFPWTQVPQQLRLVTSTGAPLRLRVGDTPCDYAAIVALDEHLVPGGNGDRAHTDVEYVDPGGQVGLVTGPENARGEREALTYRYDTLTGLVTEIVDGHGLVTAMTYDRRFGRLASVTEPTGAVTRFTYDGRGRVKEVFSPLLPPGTPLIVFDYHAEADDPWVLALHHDAANPSDPIRTVRIVDGVGKEIQNKRDATVHVPGTGAEDTMVVSGSTYFDAFGRAVRQYYPITEALGDAAAAGVFNANDDAVDPETTTYDVMDRVVKVVQPGRRQTETTYAFESGPFDRPTLSEDVVDPEGNRTRTYRDVRGYQIGVERFGPGSSSQLTRYTHDPLGQLVEVQGPAANVTRISYDLLGRTTSTEGPDTGKVDFEYDLASNQVAKITPNLRNARQRITYDYRFTRLIAIQYPDNRSNNVSYVYGAANEGNRAGRLRTLVDGTRTQERAYDAIGNLVETIDVMKVHNLNRATTPAHTFTTRWTRDTWGRVLAMTYPDGEVITNTYDSGGLVKAVAGVKSTHTYQYVDQLEYDKFGFRNVLGLGNGTAHERAYDRETLWLSRQIVHQGQRKLQDLTYSYDKVGNATERVDDIPVPPASEMGGPSRQSFAYDALYRLTGADGTYSDGNGKRHEFSQALAYDDGGRLVRKEQTDTEITSSGSALPQKATTYELAYDYDASQPLAPSHIGSRSYSWDANGNNTGWKEDASGQRRTITWDSENRAATIADQGSTTTYRYGHDGQLGIERGPQGEVEYVNQWYTALNGGVHWKDYFAGNVRVATKRVMPEGEAELMRYYLTGDLQGSVTLVTDADGRVFQHLAYFPGGEIWVRERSEIYRQPHLYAGMYHEEFRNLYRTAARWYEPREGLFLSPDPLLVRDPGASVTEPRLLADYTYAFDNPVAYVDPTGNWPIPTAARTVLEATTGIEVVDLDGHSKEETFSPTTRAGRWANRLTKTQARYSKMTDFINDFWSLNFDINQSGERETKLFNVKVKKFQKVWKNQKVQSFKQSQLAGKLKKAGSSTNRAVKRWTNSALKGIKTAFNKS
jgi:RHS repeat-associated protein